MRRREESVTCGNELFGDPYPGRGKRCQVTNKHRTQNTEHRTQNTAGGGGSGGRGLWLAWVAVRAPPLPVSVPVSVPVPVPVPVGRSASRHRWGLPSRRASARGGSTTPRVRFLLRVQGGGHGFNHREK
jgi:hypothetical protein